MVALKLELFFVDYNIRIDITQFSKLCEYTSKIDGKMKKVSTMRIGVVDTLPDFT